MDDANNPYDNLNATSFINEYNINDRSITYEQQRVARSTNDCLIHCKQKCSCFVSFIKDHFYIYIILGLMVGILCSNIYNSYVFTTILQNLHTPSPIELFITSLQMDYNFVLNFLQTNNLTFQNFAHTINSSLGLFTNMSHNAYLACTSDLLIPTIEHEKCYQT